MRFIRFSVLIFGLIISCWPLIAFDRIDVAVAPRRALPGETVIVRARAPEGAGELRAALLIPSSGRTPLALKASDKGHGWLEAKIKLEAGPPEGLYTVHVWTGDEGEPRALGKGWFISGRIMADYPILSLVDAAKPESDIDTYLEDFRSLGGTFLILHVLINTERAFYPSKIARTDVQPGSAGDYVETFLRHADRMGFACLLSVSWDMTRETDYADAPAQIRAITDELWHLYGHHASLAGFYSYQEGSGTYFVPYLRDFCGHVKSLHPGLLTACAPYVDDPLLSGYLSILDPLDIIIYQGMTMASCRPDNVKRYPLRRVHDFCGVGIGGKWLQDKIAITHTELFGYLENRASKNHSTTTYENILPQILSAATAAGSDGLSFFTYHANIHHPRRDYPDEIARPRQAVADGIAAFRIISEKVSREPNPLAFYYPYEDWVIERWATSYLPALDAFRVLGVAVDFVPFAPAAKESVYPFYPYRMNEKALERLLAEKIALVLPNVSGFHITDSDFIKAFLERGGVAMAFGPQLPMGNTYDRDQLFGAAAGPEMMRQEVLVRNPVGRRAAAGAQFGLRSGLSFPGWKKRSAHVVAEFADGSAAVFMHRVGKGIIAAFAMDAATAARDLPDIVRDVLDASLAVSGTARAVDFLGTTSDVDLASAFIPGGCRAVVINHGAAPLEVTIVPLGAQPGKPGRWTDLVSGSQRAGREADGAIVVTVPAIGYVCWEHKTER